MQGIAQNTENEHFDKLQPRYAVSPEEIEDYIKSLLKM